MTEAVKPELQSVFVSLARTFMNVSLTRRCNVSAPCPTCIHHIIIQHHDVLFIAFLLTLPERALASELQPV